jgi:hypothetical protein
MPRKPPNHLEAHQFKPGVASNPAGRARASRNRLQGDFLYALAEDFREHGVEAIRIMRIERPTEYVKCVASLMPREMQLERHTVLHEMDDDALEALKQYALQELQPSAINAVPLDLKVIANGGKID